MKIYITIAGLIISLVTWFLLWKKPIENNWDRIQKVSEKQGENTIFSEVEIQLTTQEILDKLDKDVDIIKPEIILEQESKIIVNTKPTNISEIINVVREERKIQCVKKDILSELDSLISDRNEEDSQSCNPITHEMIVTDNTETQLQPKVIIVEKKEKIISDEVTIISEINTSEPKKMVWNDIYDILSNGNISDEWEYILDYFPKQEWFIPNGNIEEFALTQTWVIHAYGKNYKHLYITLHEIQMADWGPMFEDIVGLLHKYTDKQIYFLNDDQEWGLYWDIHINFESMSESQELLQKLAQDKYVFSVNHHSVIMPIFLQDKEKIENFKTESEFQILQQLEKGVNHILIEDEDNEQSNQPIIISQPDFQSHEYFRNSENEAPQVYRYEPKPEWLIPNGNPAEFNFDSSKGLSHANGTNYKFIAFSLKDEYIETEIWMLEGMTTFLQQYISQDFYFVGDNEEESSYRTIHVNVSSYSESQELMKQLRFDPKIWTVRNRSYLLPEFQHIEKEIYDKHDEYSIFTIEKLIE